MKKYVVVILLLLCSFPYLAFAKNAGDAVLPDSMFNMATSFIEDSIRMEDMFVQLDTSIATNSTPYPLCLPLMYIPSPLKPLGDTTQENPYSIYAIRSNVRRYITAHHADLYVSISDTNRLKNLEIDDLKIHHAIVNDSECENVEIRRIPTARQSNWRRGASVSLQITQNYATNNWHQGAVNSFAMLGGAKAFANFKRENISWENSAEWRVGISTVSGDTIHKLNTTDDRFYVLSKFGYQIHKQWYVSMFAEFRTNLFPSYQKNSTRVNTTFLTPIRYTMGIGVDCKVFKGVNINFSPATYKMVYALNTDPTRVNVNDFGIKESEDIINEIGSSVRVEWRWKPIKEIAMETKFYFFTNYKQVETELEVNVDFIINRFLSAKLMLHPRYDGTVDNVAEQKSKLQFKELISVGFAHTFR